MWVIRTFKCWRAMFARATMIEIAHDMIYSSVLPIQDIGRWSAMDNRIDGPIVHTLLGSVTKTWENSIALFPPYPCSQEDWRARQTELHRRCSQTAWMAFYGPMMFVSCRRTNPWTGLWGHRRSAQGPWRRTEMRGSPPECPKQAEQANIRKKKPG